MTLIKVLLNLPWTIIGKLSALISIPTQAMINSNPLSIVYKVKSFWWYTWLPGKKGVRAMAIGNVVLLGPNIIENDLEHELVHIKQIMHRPFIQPILYTIESFRKGYRNNKYEIEAYSKSNSVYLDS